MLSFDFCADDPPELLIVVNNNRRLAVDFALSKIKLWNYNRSLIVRALTSIPPLLQ